MRKRKWIFLFIILIVGAIYISTAEGVHLGDLGTFQTKSWLPPQQIYALDTLRGVWARPDSISLYVGFGRLANAPSFSARTGADIVAASYIDSAKHAWETQPIYTYHDSVGRIDADSGVGQYSGIIRCFYQTKTTDFSFNFTVVDSPFNASMAKAARDSAIVKGESFAALNNAIDASVVANGALTFGAEITTGLPYTRAFEVDSASVDANSQFVVDTASLGPWSSNGAFLENRQLWLVNQGTDYYSPIPCVVSQVEYSGANARITVNINAPDNFAAGDDLLLTPFMFMDFATTYEMAGLNADSTWGDGSSADRRITSLDEDNVTVDLNATYVGGLTTLDEDVTTIDLNASYVGGVTVLDEDLTTIDLNNTAFGAVTSVINTVYAQLVSIAPPALDNDTSYASLKARIFTLMQKLDSVVIARSVWDDDVVAKEDRTIGHSDSTGVLGEEIVASDTAGVKQMLINNYGASPLAANIVQIGGAAAPVTNLSEAFDNDATPAGRVQYVDSLGESISGGGGGGGYYLGDGPHSLTLVVLDTLQDVPVPDADIALYANSTCAGEALYFGQTNNLGVIHLSVDTGYYYICADRVAQVSFTPAQVAHVTDDHVDSVFGYSYPNAPDQINFAMDFITPSYRNAEARFTLVGASGDIPVDTTGPAVIPTVVYDKADTSGYLETALWKNSNIYLQKRKQVGTTEWEMRVKPRGSGSWEAAPIVMRFSIPADSTHYRPQGGL